MAHVDCRDTSHGCIILVVFPLVTPLGTKTDMATTKGGGNLRVDGTLHGCTIFQL